MTGSTPEAREGTTATKAAREVLIVNALLKAGADPEWAEDGGVKASEIAIARQARARALKDPQHAGEVEKEGVRAATESLRGEAKEPSARNEYERGPHDHGNG